MDVAQNIVHVVGGHIAALPGFIADLNSNKTSPVCSMDKHLEGRPRLHCYHLPIFNMLN
jgi:hypothetical protein